MGYRNFHLFAALLTLLTLFWSLGSGHMLPSMPQESHETMAKCQTACPPFLNEPQKTPKYFLGDPDPDSPLFTELIASLSRSAIYAVLFSALIMLYLLRRPPDKFALYSIYRI